MEKVTALRGSRKTGFGASGTKETTKKTASASPRMGVEVLAACAFTGWGNDRQPERASPRGFLGAARGVGNTPSVGATTGMVGSAPFNTPEQLDHTPATTATTLQKRAGRKAVGYALAKGLTRVAAGPLMGRAYARTAYQCGALLDQKDGAIRQYWCGHRWCPVCGAIRTARAWHAYGPTVQAWQGGQMVTLTVPNCSALLLRKTVRDMHHAFATLTRALKRKYGKDAVRMIRTTEVTYNGDKASPAYGTYHPHMHLLVDGAAVAESVRDGWLERWPEAKRVAQDVRPATAGAVAELFKYTTKLLTSDKKVVPLFALDTIYTAVRGLRLWQPVGVRALTDDAAGDDTAEMDQTESTPAITRPTEEVVWAWQQGVHDWVDGATGECLTGYAPSAGRVAFLATLERMADTVSTGSTGLPALPSTAPTAAPIATDTELSATPGHSAPSATLAADSSPETAPTMQKDRKAHDYQKNFPERPQERVCYAA